MKRFPGFMVRVRAATFAALVGFLVPTTAPASSEARLPVDVRSLAVDNTYRALGYDYLTELASAFRESLEQEVLASRQKAGIDDRVLAPSYQAVYRLSDQLGLTRTGFHDGLHQVTIVGWKEKRMHLVQCRDSYPLDIEGGACGTEVRKVFGQVLTNAHIPFTWTGGVKGQFGKRTCVTASV